MSWSTLSPHPGTHIFIGKLILRQYKSPSTAVEMLGRNVSPKRLRVSDRMTEVRVESGELEKTDAMMSQVGNGGFHRMKVAGQAHLSFTGTSPQVYSPPLHIRQL